MAGLFINHRCHTVGAFACRSQAQSSTQVHPKRKKKRSKVKAPASDAWTSVSKVFFVVDFVNVLSRISRYACYDAL